MPSAKELSQATISSDDLRRVVVQDVDVSQWMPVAVRMSIRAAIETLLAELPKQDAVEVVELIDGAKANRIRRIHAASAVLMALIAPTERADHHADKRER